MKKIFLMGRSEAGKTSLTQALKGEKLHYVKTQYTNTDDDTIDSPGEYAESKHFSVGLACFSFEADVVAMVQSADEPFSLFGYGSNAFILRPLIGIITKIDSPYANVPMVRQWMLNAGCERIFLVNNVTGEGIEKFDKNLGILMEKLRDDDLLILTADHGNDPTYKGTDHTREYVPFIAYSKSMKGGGAIEEEATFAVIGATITDNFGVKMPEGTIGHSILEEL